MPPVILFIDLGNEFDNDLFRQFAGRYGVTLHWHLAVRTGLREARNDTIINCVILWSFCSRWVMGLLLKTRAVLCVWRPISSRWLIAVSRPNRWCMECLRSGETL